MAAYVTHRFEFTDTGDVDADDVAIYRCTACNVVWTVFVDWRGAPELEATECQRCGEQGVESTA